MVAKLHEYLEQVRFLVGTEKSRMMFLLPLYLVSSVVDLLSIGILVVLITTLSGNDTVVEVASTIPVIGSYASGSTDDVLLLILAGLVLLAYAIKTAIAIYANKLTLELSFLYGSKLRSFLMGVYQGQTYERYIQRNSSDYIYNIQTMAGRVVSYSIQPLLRIAGDGFVSMMIIVYLLVADPFVLVFLVSLMGIGGVSYDRAFRKKMSTYGTKENSISADMIRSITEGLNGYKESHIFGIVSYFYRAVEKSALELANARIRSQLITTSSRYMLEFIIVLSVVLIITSAVMMGRDKAELMSTLALFLVASLRLVPAVNQIVTNISRLRYGRHAVNVLYTDIKELAGGDIVDFEKRPELETLESRHAVNADFQALELKDVCFRYAQDGPWVLDTVSLTINRNDIVGLVGSSGSGKTTMIALMLGLLIPGKGSVTFDGKNLAEAENVKDWHRKVAYLPQEVFLTDDTVARNVALGVDDQALDAESLNKALDRARLREMVDKMPGGVQTQVGEKGSWVSGGQRQRIALARAFYYDSEVLILDESTSALDSETANEIISELQQLKGKVTIIVITHQAALLTLCDKVYRLDSGHLSPDPG